MQDFIDEYDQIKDTLEMLEEDITDKALKQKVKDMITILIDDYGSQYDDFEQRLRKEAKQEQEQRENEYWKSQF